eukprot:m.127853 g.127853  ORF g.127853 m.127853 type:complete len:207 (-) comp29301_c0_seq1:139-759(-)
MAAASLVRTGRLAPATTRFFCCDIQNSFRASISHFDKIVPIASRLCNAAKTLQIPVITTEQYPKGLGHTISELIPLVPSELVFPKMSFSMVIPEVASYLKANSDVKSIVIFGIETHVCVQQTTLDLLDRGYDVHVVADGVSSRSPADRMIALDRMKQSGAFITTHEAVIFELLSTAKHPCFKDVSKIIRDLAEGSDLVPPTTQKKR